MSKTPFRISFFGGGTDYPTWFRREGGAVLSTTIDKYCYITCRYLPPFFNIKHRIVWSHIETVASLSEILHPAVREGLRTLGFSDSEGLEIHHQGDLPARSGMATSSAFAVGLINALCALRGETVSSQELARQAIVLEQDVLKENVGCQDQVAVAFGGLNVIRFRQDGGFEVEPVTVATERLEELQDRLLLFYTGTSRLATEVAAGIIENLPKKKDLLVEMRQMVDRAVEIVTGEGCLDDFGTLLDETWQRKRQLSPVVSNANIDAIYRTALENGALGGKLLGAGASGFMVFYVPPDAQSRVLSSLCQLLHVPFCFESNGSYIIHES